MKAQTANILAALAILVVCNGSSALAQNTPDTVDAHLTAARTAAGFDFTGTLARLCVCTAVCPGGSGRRAGLCARS